MNFILTTKCNKGCPYCFAEFYREEANGEDMDMSFGTFIKFLDKTPRDKNGVQHVKLLGGEPTLHKDFIKMCDELINRKIAFTLISNFLFKEEIKKYIIHIIKTGVPISFLINSTNLDENEKNLEKFIVNYSEIYKELYIRDLEDKMSCGFTLENDKSAEHYTAYYDMLIDKVMKIERLRLSLPFPGDEKDKGDFWFINNHEIGDKFLKITKKAIDKGSTVSLDCIIYPCMFGNKEKYKFMKKFTTSIRHTCGDSAPADIFPNEQISFCYPTKDLISIDTNKHDNLATAVGEMVKKYKVIESTVKKPEECLECSFYKKRICKGPCLGFYNLKDETLGLNL